MNKGKCLIGISFTFMFMCVCAFGEGDYIKKFGKQNQIIQAAPYKLLKKKGKKISKKYEMKFLSLCSGRLLDISDVTSPWALNFTSNKLMTIDQARPMVKEITSNLLYYLFHKKEFEDFCKSPLRKLNLNENLIGFKIAFWDENVDRPCYPYLAQIRLVDGKISYFYANSDTQALEDPIIEQFDISSVR